MFFLPGSVLCIFKKETASAVIYSYIITALNPFPQGLFNVSTICSYFLELVSSSFGADLVFYLPDNDSFLALASILSQMILTYS